MASSSVSAYNSDSAYEQLISATISVERAPQDTLKTKRDEQERLIAVMNDFNSGISSLYTQLKTLLDTTTSPFSAKSSSVSDSSLFKVTAGDKAATGSHTLNVLRLASTDTRVSRQYTNTGSALSAFKNTTQEFTIEVAHPTSSDPNNRVAVAVSVNITGDNDKAILDQISTAVSNAMDAAVDDGTILAKEAAGISVINETSGSSRISLRSAQTGFANRLTFTDSAGGLLSTLELTADQVASGTGGGQITAIGTNDEDSSLNSKFILDGLTLYRSTNEVTDALDDVTIKLTKAGAGAGDFSVNTDTTEIKTSINSFISKYNSVLSYIAKKTTVDSSTGTRGDFSGDSAISGLRYNMRTDMARDVTGMGTGAPSRLADLGISIKNDGTLEVTDETKLAAAIEKDPLAVQKLFTGTDGYANRLKTRLDTYVGSGENEGLIKKRLQIMQDSMDRLDDQIEVWDDKLARRETELRTYYANFQATVSLLQSQQSAFLSLLNYS